MARKALVAGATGMIGRELVSILVQDERFSSIAVLVRKPVQAWEGIAKVNQIVVDYEQLDKLPAEIFEEADLFCALGTTIKKAKTQDNFRRVDHEYPLVLGQLAKRYGARIMLIVTAMGANPKSRVFYNRVKGQVEEDLANLALPKLYILRPSLLLGERDEHRKGEKVVTVLARWIPGALFGKYRPIAGSTVAQAMVNVAAGAAAPERIDSNQIARIAGYG